MSSITEGEANMMAGVRQSLSDLDSTLRTGLATPDHRPSTDSPQPHTRPTVMIQRLSARLVGGDPAQAAGGPAASHMRREGRQEGAACSSEPRMWPIADSTGAIG